MTTKLHRLTLHSVPTALSMPCSSGKAATAPATKSMPSSTKTVGSSGANPARFSRRMSALSSASVTFSLRIACHNTTYPASGLSDV